MSETTIQKIWQVKNSGGGHLWTT